MTNRDARERKENDIAEELTEDQLARVGGGLDLRVSAVVDEHKTTIGPKGEHPKL